MVHAGRPVELRLTGAAKVPQMQAVDSSEQMFYTIDTYDCRPATPGPQMMKLAHVLIPDFPIQVEILGNPSLRQKPVVIGGRPDQEGSVLACSPAARRGGMRGGMLPAPGAASVTCRPVSPARRKHGA